MGNSYRDNHKARSKRGPKAMAKKKKRQARRERIHNR